MRRTGRSFALCKPLSTSGLCVGGATWECQGVSPAPTPSPSMPPQLPQLTDVLDGPTAVIHQGIFTDPAVDTPDSEGGTPTEHLTVHESIHADPADDMPASGGGTANEAPGEAITDASGTGIHEIKLADPADDMPASGGGTSNKAPSESVIITSGTGAIHATRHWHSAVKEARADANEINPIHKPPGATMNDKDRYTMSITLAACVCIVALVLLLTLRYILSSRRYLAWIQHARYRQLDKRMLSVASIAVVEEQSKNDASSSKPQKATRAKAKETEADATAPAPQLKLKKAVASTAAPPQRKTEADATAPAPQLKLKKAVGSRVRSAAQRLEIKAKDTTAHSCGTAPLLPPTNKETDCSLHVSKRSVKDRVRRLNADS